MLVFVVLVKRDNVSFFDAANRLIGEEFFLSSHKMKQEKLFFNN